VKTSKQKEEETGDDGFLYRQAKMNDDATDLN
jgi:hypothetical protein